MSLLLQPIALESCQTGLRGRRSSIGPTNSARLFSAARSCLEGSALADDADHDKGVLLSFNVTIPTLSALAHAQLPDTAIMFLKSLYPVIFPLKLTLIPITLCLRFRVVRLLPVLAVTKRIYQFLVMPTQS